jgi:hypothetical protein
MSPFRVPPLAMSTSKAWRRNIAGLYGITVNFVPNGSTNGRNDFRNGLVDFAVWEIPYGLRDGGCSTRIHGGRSGTCRSWPVPARRGARMRWISAAAVSAALTA